MAREKRSHLTPRKPGRWVRTGGADSDPSMDEGEEFVAKGSGVGEAVREVGDTPNEGIGLKNKLEGHTR